jgi:thiosulfate/3-mercaptopyruvate sulfurtransferase
MLITAEQLNQRLGDSNLIIFDASKPDQYNSEHIPGALNVPWQKLSNVNGKPGDKGWGVSLNKTDLTQALESLGVDNTKTVVCYTDVLKGPGPDGRIVWQLQMAGFNKVKLLYGGLEAWKANSYPVTKEPGKAIPTSGLALNEFDQGYDATTEYVADTLGQVKLIDCRTKKEYDGATPNGEARGGHIQGAVFLEWKELLNPDATPKKADEITSIMKTAGVNPEDELIIY